MDYIIVNYKKTLVQRNVKEICQNFYSLIKNWVKFYKRYYYNFMYNEQVGLIERGIL